MSAHYFVDERISIHAPREGSDLPAAHVLHGPAISIHAPREGSDCIVRLHAIRNRNFNPRSP